MQNSCIISNNRFPGPYAPNENPRYKPSNNVVQNNIKVKTKLFPYLQNMEHMKKLRIDKHSLSTISLRDIAEKITLIILKHTKHNIKEPISKSNMTITDATAGVGGNTISFANYFKKVNAVELDFQRFCFLQNNINVYELNNVDVYNYDYTKLFNNLEQDIVFIDPPWGGRNYKAYDLLRLGVSNMSLETLCDNIFKYNKCTKYIVLKLPYNYDLKYIDEKIDKKTYVYDLEKMLILIIEN